MEQLDVGEITSLRAGFYNSAGAYADPTSIVLTITKPNGATVTKTTPDLTHDGTGLYHYDQVVDVAGVWEYNYNGQGTVDATQSSLFLAGIDLYDGPLEPWCNWDEVAAQPVFNSAGLNPSTLSAAVREGILDSTSELLFNMSRRVYPGIGKTTRSLCVRCWGCGSMWGYGDNGYGFGSCGCNPSGGQRIEIAGRYPVLGIRNVMINGVALDVAQYRMEDYRWLVRLDGFDWPYGVDLTDPTGLQGTWFYGRPIPTGGRRVAAQLCAEEALASMNVPCMLPQYRVASAQVEGVSYTIIDQTKALDDGVIGFYPADRWLHSINTGRRVEPGAFDPGATGVVSRRMT